MPRADDVADPPPDVRGRQVEEPGRSRREASDVEARVEEDRRDVGAGQQIVQVVVRLLQLGDLVLELRVDGAQLLVERLELLLGGLELLVGGAQLLVDRHDLFVDDLQLLIGALQVPDAALQLLARRP